MGETPVKVTVDEGLRRGTGRDGGSQGGNEYGGTPRRVWTRGTLPRPPLTTDVRELLVVERGPVLPEWEFLKSSRRRGVSRLDSAT